MEAFPKPDATTGIRGELGVQTSKPTPLVRLKRGVTGDRLVALKVIFPPIKSPVAAFHAPQPLSTPKLLHIVLVTGICAFSITNEKNDKTRITEEIEDDVFMNYALL